MSEKIGGAEATKLTEEFTELERVSCLSFSQDTLPRVVETAIVRNLLMHIINVLIYS